MIYYELASLTDLSGLGDINTLTGNIQNVDKSKVEQYLEQFLDWLADKTFSLVVALIFLFIGFKISKFIIRMIRKSFDKTDLETSVSGFLLSLIKGVLYSIVFIMAASIVGFQVTSLVTILGTASLAIGLALQGSLSNFAGGILILIMKPFRVGDYIIENDKMCEGVVTSIDIFYTKLKTVDNKVIVIPNGNITSHSIVNVTAEGERKLEVNIGVSYHSNIKLVKDTLEEIVRESEYFDDTKDLDVYVDSFQDNCIRMGIRFFVKAEDYWNAKWEMNEKIKIRFDERGIEIPFSQVVVTMNTKKEDRDEA